MYRICLENTALLHLQVTLLYNTKDGCNWPVGPCPRLSTCPWQHVHCLRRGQNFPLAVRRRHLLPLRAPASPSVVLLVRVMCNFALQRTTATRYLHFAITITWRFPMNGIIEASSTGSFLVSQQINVHR